MHRIRIIIAAFGVLLFAAPALADEGWFERWKPCIDQGLIERADIDRVNTFYEQANMVAVEKIVRQPAERGCAVAQIYIAVFHFAGVGGLEFDDVAGYAWLEVAIRGGLPEAADARDLLASLMTPEQIAEAKRQARSWKPHN